MGYKDKVHVTAVSILLEAAAQVQKVSYVPRYRWIGPLSNSRTRISLQKVRYNLHDIAKGLCSFGKCVCGMQLILKFCQPFSELSEGSPFLLMQITSL